jgi:cytochrome P450
MSGRTEDADRDAALRPPLNAHEQLADPYGGFGRVREETRVARGMWGGEPAWFVTRHDDAVTVLSDPRFVGNTASLPDRGDDYAEAFATMGVRAELIPYMAGNLAALDPPDHTRLRAVVSRALSAPRISALRPRMEAVAAELADALPAHAVNGAVDLVENFTGPLSVATLCALAGVPARERTRWHSWTDDYVSMDPRRIETMLEDMSAHVRAEVERRRAEPADDLIGELVRARDEDGALSDTELITLVLTVIVAGHKTTPHLIANGILGLLTHPDQLALLRADPALIPGAVQEVLRWRGPAIVARLRHAAEDVTIGDTLIRRGDRVQVVLGAADHDPRCHAHPERLDVTRRHGAPGAANLAYAAGAHRCVGAGLADQEIEVAFATLFRRYPELTPAVPPDRLTWRPIPLTRQLAQLPVMLKDPK